MIVFMAAGAVGGALFTVNPLDPGQTMTAAIASLATGTDQVAGEGLAFQSLFFVGPGALSHDPGTQLREQSNRPTLPGGLLMTTKLSDRQRVTQDAVRAQIEGKRSEPGAVIFRLLLIMMLLSSLLILVVLLADIFAGAWPTFRDRGLDFVTSGLSLNPETAGVWTGDRRVFDHRLHGRSARHPDRRRRSRLPRGIRTGQHPHAMDRHCGPQSGRCSLDRVRASRPCDVRHLGERDRSWRLDRWKKRDRGRHHDGCARSTDRHHHVG